MHCKRCLVVDDSRVARKVARRILEEMSFVVEEAADGQQALAACAANMPQLILLDWNMPVMNGIQFLRHLREMAHGREPVVMFCTTENQIDAVREAIESGANEFIMKPFDGDILRTKLELEGLL